MTKIALMLLAGATVSTTALAAEPMTRDEVRSMVSEMMADAETRSSLLQGGGMAGYDKGFLVGSADGNFKMKVNGLIQFRYLANFRDDNDALGAPPANDDVTNGFQMRKARVVFSGNVINPNLTYVVALEENTDGSADWIGNDIYFAYDMGDGWKVRGGQYKVGFLREELNSERNTITMERGVFNSVFSQGRSQGMGFMYGNDTWRWAMDISDGFNTADTDINSPAESEFAGTVRGEFKFEGDWSSLAEYTSKPGEKTAASVGFAGHWQHGTELSAQANPVPNPDGGDTWALTVDALWKSNGWSVFGAFAYTNEEINVAGADDINTMGFMLQGAYRFSETGEVFARWDGIFLDDDDTFVAGPPASGVDTTRDEDMHFISFGYNHYFAGNAAKLTVQAIWSLNDTTNLTTANLPFSGNGLGTNNNLLGSADDGEIGLGAQFQLSF